jgi:hypothetical protein
MRTPYETHASHKHHVTTHSPNGIDLIEECTECPARFLVHHTEPEFPRQLDPLPPAETHLNGYKIRRNSFWTTYQVSHPAIGSCGEFTFYQDAINYCKAG